MIYISPIRLNELVERQGSFDISSLLSKIDNECRDGIFSIDGLQIPCDDFKKIITHCYASSNNLSLHKLVFEQKGMLRMLETYSFNPLAQIIAKGWNNSTKAEIYEYFGPFLSFSLNEFCEDELKTGKLNNVVACAEHWKSLTPALSLEAQKSTLTFFDNINEALNSSFIDLKIELGNFHFYTLFNALTGETAAALRNNVAEKIVLYSKRLIESDPKTLSSILLNAKGLNCSDQLHKEISDLYTKVDIGNKTEATINFEEANKSGFSLAAKLGIALSLTLIIGRIVLFTISDNTHQKVNPYENMKLEQKNYKKMIEYKLKQDSLKSKLKQIEDASQK